MSTFKVMRDIDPLTRRPHRLSLRGRQYRSHCQPFRRGALREEDIAANCALSIARQHRGAAKAWKQAAAILRATTIMAGGGS